MSAAGATAMPVFVVYSEEAVRALKAENQKLREQLDARIRSADRVDAQAFAIHSAVIAENRELTKQNETLARSRRDIASRHALLTAETLRLIELGHALVADNERLNASQSAIQAEARALTDDDSFQRLRGTRAADFIWRLR